MTLVTHSDTAWEPSSKMKKGIKVEFVFKEKSRPCFSREFGMLIPDLRTQNSNRRISFDFKKSFFVRTWSHASNRPLEFLIGESDVGFRFSYVFLHHYFRPYRRILDWWISSIFRPDSIPFFSPTSGNHWSPFWIYWRQPMSSTSRIHKFSHLSYTVKFNSHLVYWNHDLQVPCVPWTAQQ